MSGEESAAIALLTRAVELDSSNRYTEVYLILLWKVSCELFLKSMLLRLKFLF